MGSLNDNCYKELQTQSLAFHPVSKGNHKQVTNQARSLVTNDLLLVTIIIESTVYTLGTFNICKKT